MNPSRCLDQVVAISARLDRLDKAVKVWSVRTYKLVSVGPPPVYELPWQQNHLVMVRGWESFCRNWQALRTRAHKQQYTNKTAMDIEGYAIALDSWQKTLTRAGVDLDDKAIEKLTSKDKTDPLPWSNTALILGGLGFAAWIGTPYLRGLFSPKDKPLTGTHINDDKIKEALSSPAAQRRRLAARRLREESILAVPSTEQMSRQLNEDMERDDLYFERPERPDWDLPGYEPPVRRLGAGRRARPEVFDGQLDDDGDEG